MKFTKIVYPSDLLDDFFGDENLTKKGLVNFFYLLLIKNDLSFDDFETAFKKAENRVNEE